MAWWNFLSFLGATERWVSDLMQDRRFVPPSDEVVNQASEIIERQRQEDLALPLTEHHCRHSVPAIADDLAFIGWDGALQTYFVQVGPSNPDDPNEINGERKQLWVGTTYREIPTIDALADLLWNGDQRPWAQLSPEMGGHLEAYRKADLERRAAKGGAENALSLSQLHSILTDNGVPLENNSFRVAMPHTYLVTWVLPDDREFTLSVVADSPAEAAEYMHRVTNGAESGPDDDAWKALGSRSLSEGDSVFVNSQRLYLSDEGWRDGLDTDPESMEDRLTRLLLKGDETQGIDVPEAIVAAPQWHPAVTIYADVTKPFQTSVPVKNQRVRHESHGNGTIIDTSRNDSVIIQLDRNPVQREFLRSALNFKHDSRFPMFAIRDWEGTLIFHTPEPVSEGNRSESEEEQMRERGLQWWRCYSEIVPDGECGHVNIGSLTPLTPEQFEEGRQNGWKAIPSLGLGTDLQRKRRNIGGMCL